MLTLVLLGACHSRQGAGLVAEQAVVVAPVVEELVIEASPLVHPRGVGPWRLGMSRYDVIQVDECRRFTPERMTGGFQCDAWMTPLGERRISFVFDELYRLSKIQLWIYGGESAEDAQPWAEATWEALDFLSQQGEVSSSTHPESMGLSKEELVASLVGVPADFPFSMHVDVAKYPEVGTRVWMSVIASPHGRFAFLFVGK